MLPCRHAPHKVDRELDRELVERYTESHRTYHTLAHVAEVLRWFDVVADEASWDAPDDVYDAILFHDAIYDPSRKDNEERSADLALARHCSPHTADLIRLTARHGQLGIEDVERDAAHFLDSDTAILGAVPESFEAYDDAIRLEYSFLSDVDFRAGRRAFLRGLRDRPRIYLSPLFYARFEAQARANIENALGSRYV